MSPNRIFRSVIRGTFAILAGSSFSLAQQAGDSPVKIFIMAGQSNMLGQGEMTPASSEGTLEYIVANDPGNEYQFLGTGGGSWVVRDDVWIRDQSGDLGGLTAGYGSNSGTVGPELGFGHFAGDLYDKQILIVKAAWGGKDLANDFRPPSSGGTTGFYYNEVLRLTNEAITNLDTYFPDYDETGGFEIAGVCWHQGWNDRVDSGRSAEYEFNMANFIRDIRSDLGVPGLPFVIATSAMDSGPTYSVVELAQLEMANTVSYPEFDGNVAVIDARMDYGDLEFWQAPENSPANQGFHWNRNAKTYVNLGLAMGDAMSTLSQARCPSRLRASGSEAGVLLTWQNGSEVPTSVRILRNGVEIAATAPVDPASYLDASAEPGVYNYELQFAMPGEACPPQTESIDVGITDLQIFRSPDGIALSWTNNLGYTAIEVRRDDVLLDGALSGAATSFTDATPPASGIVTYSVVPSNGSAAPTEFEINLDGPPSGEAVIYEPFDYTVGGLNLQGGSEAGLDGQWFANSTTQVTAGTYQFGTLPVGGAKLSDFTGGQNRFGGSRAILPAALADNGLLNDGATLWFSFITGIQEGANRTNSRLALALAAAPFGSGNGDFFISGGTGIGFDMRSGVPRAAFFPDGSGDSTRAGNNSPQFQVDETGLIVGRIVWGSGPGELDTIELFQPDINMLLPASPISTLTATVDQSTFDTLTFRRGDRPVLDEIRFGGSFDDVIGADLLAPDLTPPNPDPLTWAIEPIEAGDNQITMTATTATDSGGVEYFFEETSGNPGGSDSDWQDSPIYTDTGLEASTLYAYRVKARDKSSNANETDWAPERSANTPAPDNTPPTPSQMSWESEPVALSTSEITMTAITASDSSGVEYYFAETSGNPGGSDSGWQESSTYIDTELESGTTYAYTVTARDQSSNANENTTSDPPASAATRELPNGPGGALLYEPFDYAGGFVSGDDGGTGFDGSWTNTRNSPTVLFPSKAWGVLSTEGGFARGAAWSGVTRSIGSTLSDAGLMNDGATLWFSVIMDLEGQNTANADINVALGSDKFVSGTFGDRENLASGEGIGVTHSRGTIQGVYWQDDDADVVSERTENSSSLVIEGGAGASTRALVVGRIEWGADGSAMETLTLFAPDANLVQGAPITSAWSIPALDQSQFNTLAIQFKDTAQVDEIRFGATYEDAVGIGGANDYGRWASNYPEADLSEANGDLDKDGVSNDEERLWGLDPTSASSLNPYTTPLAPDGGTFSYTRRDTTLSGMSYDIYTSTDLVTWTKDDGAIQAAGDPDGNDVETVEVTLSAPAVNSRLFVQILVVE